MDEEGVEEWRERGLACLLGMERLREGLVTPSFSLRSNFGMENGSGESSPEILRLELRSGFIS